MLKQKVREKMLSERRALASEEKNHLDASINQHILSSNLFQDANFIGLYCALKGEVDITLLFYEATAAQKALFVPKMIHSEEFSFCSFSEPLSKNAWGILEPIEDNYVSIDALELIFVPLLAFDLHFTRLGFGKGLYDKLLNTAQKPPTVIGVCYDFQEVELLPQDSWDYKLDGVVTEQGFRLRTH